MLVDPAAAPVPSPRAAAPPVSKRASRLVGERPGSLAHAQALRAHLQQLVWGLTRGRVRLEALLTELVRYKAWRHLQDEHGLPFSSLESFCVTPRPCGLGWSLAVIQGLLAEQRDPVVAATRAASKPLAGHGRRPSPEQRARQGLAPQPVGAKIGTRAYWLERLARDNPALLERLKAGEFRSVREAAIEAGLTYRYVTVRGDPQVIAAAALSLLDRAGVATLIGYLRDPRTLPAARLEKRTRSTRAWAAKAGAAA
jgi:hypothetical protein